MMCWISRAMSSNVDCSSCLAEISLYSASSTASRSPSSVNASPVVSLIVRMSGSESFEGAGLIGVSLDEFLRPRRGQLLSPALLAARGLGGPPRGVRLPIQIHQTADRGAVDV